MTPGNTGLAVNMGTSYGVKHGMKNKGFLSRQSSDGSDGETRASQSVQSSRSRASSSSSSSTSNSKLSFPWLAPNFLGSSVDAVEAAQEAKVSAVQLAIGNPALWIDDESLATKIAQLHALDEVSAAMVEAGPQGLTEISDDFLQLLFAVFLNSDSTEAQLKGSRLLWLILSGVNPGWEPEDFPPRGIPTTLMSSETQRSVAMIDEAMINGTETRFFPYALLPLILSSNEEVVCYSTACLCLILGRQKIPFLFDDHADDLDRLVHALASNSMSADQRIQLVSISTLTSIAADRSANQAMTGAGTIDNLVAVLNRDESTSSVVCAASICLRLLVQQCASEALPLLLKPAPSGTPGICVVLCRLHDFFFETANVRRRSAASKSSIMDSLIIAGISLRSPSLFALMTSNKVTSLNIIPLALKALDFVKTKQHNLNCTAILSELLLDLFQHHSCMVEVLLGGRVDAIKSALDLSSECAYKNMPLSPDELEQCRTERTMGANKVILQLAEFLSVITDDAALRIDATKVVQSVLLPKIWIGLHSCLAASDSSEFATANGHHATRRFALAAITFLALREEWAYEVFRFRQAAMVTRLLDLGHALYSLCASAMSRERIRPYVSSTESKGHGSFSSNNSFDVDGDHETIADAVAAIVAGSNSSNNTSDDVHICSSIEESIEPEQETDDKHEKASRLFFATICVSLHLVTRALSSLAMYDQIIQKQASHDRLLISLWKYFALVGHDDLSFPVSWDLLCSVHPNNHILKNLCMEHKSLTGPPSKSYCDAPTISVTAVDEKDGQSLSNNQAEAENFNTNANVFTDQQKSSENCRKRNLVLNAITVEASLGKALVQTRFHGRLSNSLITSSNAHELADSQDAKTSEEGDEAILVWTSRWVDAAMDFLKQYPCDNHIKAKSFALMTMSLRQHDWTRLWRNHPESSLSEDMWPWVPSVVNVLANSLDEMAPKSLSRASAYQNGHAVEDVASIRGVLSTIIELVLPAGFERQHDLLLHLKFAHQHSLNAESAGNTMAHIVVHGKPQHVRELHLSESVSQFSPWGVSFVSSKDAFRIGKMKKNPRLSLGATRNQNHAHLSKRGWTISFWARCESSGYNSLVGDAHVNNEAAQGSRSLHVLASASNGDFPVAALATPDGIELGCMETVTEKDQDDVFTQLQQRFELFSLAGKSRSSSIDRHSRWHGSGFAIDRLVPGWHHFVVVSDGESTRFFMDSSQQGETVHYATQGADLQMLGNSLSLQHGFLTNWIVADFRLYGTAIPPATIAASPVRVAFNRRPWEMCNAEDLAHEVARDRLGALIMGSLLAAIEFDAVEIRHYAAEVLMFLAAQRCNLARIVAASGTRTLDKYSNISAGMNSSWKQEHNKSCQPGSYICEFGAFTQSTLLQVLMKIQ